jgi:hypothetical protein
MDRNAAIFQNSDFFGIDIEAEHIVADIRQASARNQTDIAGANHGDFHSWVLSGVQEQPSWVSEGLQRLMATQEQIMPEQKPVIVRAMPDNPVTASLLHRVRLTDNRQRGHTDCILAVFSIPLNSKINDAAPSCTCARTG